MKFRLTHHKRNSRFGYFPREQQQLFLRYGNKLASFTDLYFRLFGVPDITQHIRFRHVSKLLDTKAGHVIIDLGCGYGLFSTWLASMGVRVIGIDTDSDKIKFAQKTAKILHIRNRSSYVMASVDSLPFKEKSFDYLLCLDVIEHIPNDLNALSEMSRILKPSGILILTTPCQPQKFRFKSGIELHEHWGHVREGYSFEHLKTIIGDRCMEIVSCFSWLKYFTSKVFDFYFKFFWEQHSKFRLLLCALLFPLMCMVSFLDDIFFRRSQGNEFALKIVKLRDSK